MNKLPLTLGQVPARGSRLEAEFEKASDGRTDTRNFIKRVKEGDTST